MKKSPFLLVALLLCFQIAVSQETEEETEMETEVVEEEIIEVVEADDDQMEDVLDYMEDTSDELKETMNGLSEAQLMYKPQDSVWSAMEVMEHIILSEAIFFDNLQKKASGPEDSAEKLEEITVDDDKQMVAGIKDRSNKVKTFPALEPAGKYASYDEAWDAFKKQRENITDFLKDTDADLEKYVFDMPMGKVNGIQMLKFMAGHTSRHVAQIEELKGNSGYPGM